MVKLAVFCLYITLSSSPLAGNLFYYIYDLNDIFIQYDINTLYKYWNISVSVSSVLVGLILFDRTNLTVMPLSLSLRELLILVSTFVSMSVVVNYLSSTIGYALDPNYLLKELNSYIPMFEVTGELIDWKSVVESTLVFCMLIPLTEEIVYRGMILRELSKNMSPYLSTFLSSIPFALIHHHFLHPFVLGLILGLVYLRFGLLVTVILHTSHNLILLVVNVGYFQIEGNYMIPSLDWTPLALTYSQVAAILVLLLLYKRIKKLQVNNLSG